MSAAPFRRGPVAASLISLFLVQTATADDAVVITASRTAQQVANALSDVTVLNETDIRNAQTQDLVTLLQSQPGVELTRNGGPGSVSGLFLRGGNSNHTLVLVDGMRIGSVTLGTTQLGALTLDQIQRIEIVRGNVSSLYGSEAVGGVIQIFTRQGAGAASGGATAGFGSEGSANLGAHLGGSAGPVRLQFGISQNRARGKTALDPAIVPGTDPDRDGFHNQTATLSAIADVSHGWSAGLRAWDTQAWSDYDVAGSMDKRRGTSAVSNSQIFAEGPFSTDWRAKLSFSESADRYATSTNGGFGPYDSDTRSKQRQWSWQNDWAVADGHTAVFGAERLTQTAHDPNTAYTHADRQVNALYASYLGDLGAHHWQANLRADDYSDFGRRASHYLAYGFDAAKGWRLLASVGTAFRAPTVNELYYPGYWGWSVGNPALKPESAENRQAGFQYTGSYGTWRVVRFRNEVRNMIQWTGPMGSPINVGEARVDGTEATFNGQWAGVEIHASLNLENPRDLSNGEPLLRRAKRYGNLSLAREFGAWRLGANLRGAGERRDMDPLAWPMQPANLNGYSVLDLTTRYRIDSHWQLGLRAENVTNRHYELVRGYTTPGPGLYLQMSYLR